MKHLNLLSLLLALTLSPSLVFSQQSGNTARFINRPTAQQDEDKSDRDSDSQQQQAEDQDSEKSDSQDEKESAQSSDTEKEKNQTREGRRGRRSGGFRANSKQSKEFIAAFEPVVSSTCDAVVRLLDGKKQVALGMIVDSDGLVLTKLSELKGDLKCKLPDGKTVKPDVIGIDPDTDLVLLRVNRSDLPTAELKDRPLPPVGSWLATVDQESVPLTVGIVSHDARRIPNNRLNSAVIGIYPEDIADADGVRVNIVVFDSPAEKAGVLVNDVIVAIDDEVIRERADLMETLSHFAPGDEIVLKIQRGDKELQFDVTLGKRRTNPMMERGMRQNQLGSTLSRRRGDFPLALQHDSTLNANQCGGPVVDLDGDVVGINIARDGRVSSLALPNEVVIPIIEKLRTGKYQPQVVNKSEIRQVEDLLSKLTTDMGSLPAEKTKKEIEFSAGNAVEKELEKQVKEAEKRLEALQARLEEKRKLNKVVVDSLADLDAKQKRIERRKAPLEQDLKRLKTGVR